MHDFTVIKSDLSRLTFDALTEDDGTYTHIGGSCCCRSQRVARRRDHGDFRSGQTVITRFGSLILVAGEVRGYLRRRIDLILEQDLAGLVD
jgi:hypothetical protein